MTASCYCSERESNPRLAEELKDIPEGYCGICEVCGRPGHLRAHPRAPTSGAWCDAHWEELSSRRIFTLGDVVRVVYLVVVVVGTVLVVWKVFG